MNIIILRIVYLKNCTADMLVQDGQSTNYPDRTGRTHINNCIFINNTANTALFTKYHPLAEWQCAIEVNNSKFYLNKKSFNFPVK